MQHHQGHRHRKATAIPRVCLHLIAGRAIKLTCVVVQSHGGLRSEFKVPACGCCNDILDQAIFELFIDTVVSTFDTLDDVPGIIASKADVSKRQKLI